MASGKIVPRLCLFGPETVLVVAASLSFHRTSQQAAHKVALQGKEDCQREQHGEEGARGQQMPVAAERAG